MESEDNQEEEEEEKEEEEEVEVEDCDYDGDDDNVNDDDYDDDNKYDDEEEDDNRNEFKDLVLGRKRKPLDDGNDVNVIRSMPLIGDKENRVTRYSANVVLLAHGNRSLYVLTIQRNQVTSIDSCSFTRYRNHRSSSTTMISYKL